MMKYSRVYLDAMGYELGPNVVTSPSLEGRLAPVYEKLRIGPGQLEALTGIRERRWWNRGAVASRAAAAAARKALQEASVPPDEIGVLIYGGVCRDHLEPATAAHVAAQLDLPPDLEVYDISNACLGVMNGIVAIANRIELGQIRAGMVVSCETSREINEIMIGHMLAHPDMETFRMAVATLTGGSGAVAFILSDGSRGMDRPRLRGGVHRAAPAHHELCRWHVGDAVPFGLPQYFETDGVAVLKHGTALGVETWNRFLPAMGWTAAEVDRVVCHQVGRQHRDTILRALGVDVSRDFSTFEHLGNMGTVSLPLTAAVAAERGAIERGQRVGFLGIGSGLNCLMLGWDW
jgi:acyl-CoA:acyl-CoA alkyltransferase